MISRKQRKPDASQFWPRPKTRGDAVRQIEAVYKANDWSDAEQMRHRQFIGMTEKQLADYTNDELKTILGDFEQGHMILYRD